jgi:hypothetical protein
MTLPCEIVGRVLHRSGRYLPAVLRLTTSDSPRGATSYPNSFHQLPGSDGAIFSKCASHPRTASRCEGRCHPREKGCPSILRDGEESPGEVFSANSKKPRQNPANRNAGSLPQTVRQFQRPQRRRWALKKAAAKKTAPAVAKRVSAKKAPVNLPKKNGTEGAVL